MSDPENTPVEPEVKPTEEPTKTQSLIEQNVALLMAENDRKDDLILELTSTLAETRKRLEQADDMLAEKAKAKLIFDIAPKTQVPKELLALKSVEDLKKMKKVLDLAKVPVFKSSAPIASLAKSPEAKLASTFDDYMKGHAKVR